MVKRQMANILKTINVLSKVVACVLAFSSCAHAMKKSASDQVFSFGDMSVRNIGPAVVSGRVMSIVGVPGEPNTLLVGGATSGVWKTEDAGTTWYPITDNLDTSSIGVIAINQQDPDVIWVGTGEPKPRYGTGHGTGVYKSVDGGKTWQKKGLLDSERIQRILLHPTNSDIAYVAVVGPAWSDGQERGVFKTIDGGETWKRILFTNSSSGAADLVIDPSNPDRLIAAMWDFRREPWFFRSGGPGSGLFLTEDGGDSWKPLGAGAGLPSGDLGRIGLAFAPSDPKRVYALVEAEESGFYRSDDGGHSWVLTSNSKRQFTILSRPWYFQTLLVDPGNADKVYHKHDQLEVSVDGGYTFTNITGGKNMHPDQHALWLDPANTNNLWLGNDGGVFVSHSDGDTWEFVDNLPMAQLYNVTVDNEIPYNVYTTIQDQANWRGPSSSWTHNGLVNENWVSFPGGESSFVLPIKNEPRYVYSLGNMGPIYLTDIKTGVTDNISPASPSPDIAIRRNNAAAVALNPFDKNGIYYGSQFVHKSLDRGKSWEIISPDLTTNNPEKQKYWNSGGLTWENFGGSTHTTIIVIAPSPIDPNVIWVGTDDGNIQVTRDGGNTWANVSASLLDLSDAPKEGFWVASIEPSRYDASEAFVALNDYRRGDKKPYLFRTVDSGSSWQSLAGSNVRGPGHFIEQDLKEPTLLFWSTEFGLYISFDKGSKWHLYGGLPIAAVRGTVVHERDADLVIATFGRGAYIMDDITPLREIAKSPEVLEKPVHLFGSAPVMQYRKTYKAIYSAQSYRAENEAYGITANFNVADDAKEPVKVTITDASGAIVHDAVMEEVKAGLNRYTWNLQTKPAAAVPSYYEGWGATFYNSGEVPPGVYTVSVSHAGHAEKGLFEVKPDPRFQASDEDQRLKIHAMHWTQAAVGKLMQGYHDTEVYIAKIDDFLAQNTGDERTKVARKMRDELNIMKRRIHLVFGQRTVHAEPYDETMRREWPGGVVDYVTRLVWPIVSNLAKAPSPNQIRMIQNAEARMAKVAADFNALMTGEVAPFAHSAGLAPKLVPAHIDFEPFQTEGH